VQPEKAAQNLHFCPQVVDKFVDKYRNSLQKAIFFLNALALWRGVRNNPGWG
jgi:hypothetical protein